jgi:fumarate reductase flavoprotein subunit
MQGLRFVREDTTYAYHCRSLYNESMKWGGAHGCTWLVADNKMTTSDHDSCTWSDKAKKCTRDADIASGKLLRADTIEDLASAMGVSATNLRATVDTWNAAAAAGTDAEFGRSVQLAPLDQPPFFAWKTINSNIGAIGGLKINTDAAILDRSGNPIPHLFGAGANTGGWIGPYYPGSGTCLQGALNWGRIAGRSAAKA